EPVAQGMEDGTQSMIGSVPVLPTQPFLNFVEPNRRRLQRTVERMKAGVSHAILLDLLVVTERLCFRLQLRSITRRASPGPSVRTRKLGDVHSRLRHIEQILEQAGLQQPRPVEAPEVSSRPAVPEEPEAVADVLPVEPAPVARGLRQTLLR